MNFTKPTVASVVARFPIAEEVAARRLLDQLCECWEPEELPARPTRRQWRLERAVDFKAAPNETAVRALVALVAGESVARALVFERIGAGIG